MKKKNIIMILIIFMAVITVFSVGTYAYFAVNFQDERNEKDNNTNLNTELLSDAVVVSNVEESAGSFLIEDIYPGHKEVASIKVDVSGKKDSKIGIKLIYDMKENGLKDNVKISIYKSNKEIKTTNNYFECEKQTETVEGITKYYETCKEKNLELLISETVLNEEVKKLDLVVDTIYISEENQNETIYYYAVVEFINKEDTQNEVMSKKLEGNVLVEVVPPIDKTFEESVVAYGNLGNNIAESMLYSSHLDKTNLIFDETVDNNLRYVGASPNNYVDFNGEKWRIIGVMNNVEDSVGNIDSRIKLIRDESIGKFSWDNSSTANNGDGVNEWSQAKLMKLMNPGFESETVGGSLYWNGANGMCYNSWHNGTTSCSFTDTGLKNESKQMIESIMWHTGSNGKEADYDNILTNKFYEYERSNNTGKICLSGPYCSDNVERTTIWLGYIGLMYPSDYGYATSGGNTTNRETCLKNILSSWDILSDCYNNNWLYKAGITQWLMIPSSSNSNNAYVFRIISSGGLSGGWTAFNANSISPVIYLKKNVKIVNGKGTKESPYELEMEV